MGALMNASEAPVGCCLSIPSKKDVPNCFGNRAGLIGGSAGVDPPFAVHGGIFREEAIMLLRRFYVQENQKGMSTHERTGVEKADINQAPEPKTKKNRELKTEIVPLSADK